MEQETISIVLWPFLVYGLAVLMIVGGMLLLSYFLGEKHKDLETDEVYESGIMPTESARVLFPIHFYLIALFFVIFDIEAVFIFAWAIAIKALGWHGYIAIVVFIGVLFSVIFYEWRVGAFDFGPNTKKIVSAYRKQKKRSKNEMVDHKSR